MLSVLLALRAILSVLLALRPMLSVLLVAVADIAAVCWYLYLCNLSDFYCGKCGRCSV
jgi:hypothetical protein